MREARSVTIKCKTRAVAGSGFHRGAKTPSRSLAGTQCMNRWDEGSWDMISLDTEGSPSWMIRGKIAFIKQNKRMLLKLYPIINYSVLDTMIFITLGSVLEV